MSVTKAVFVLIYGGWHNHSAWDRVTPIFKADGFAALTLDLPGAGVNSIALSSLGLRSFDPAAFAAEWSPISGVTQEERTQTVVALVKEAASLSAGKVVLVGHSAGGMTISAVYEQVPNLLLAVIYIAGFMVPNGIRCTQDRAIPSTGQDHMIAMVDGAVGGKTATHTMESSHSPFLSQPAILSKILIDICFQSLAEQSAEAP